MAARGGHAAIAARRCRVEATGSVAAALLANGVSTFRITGISGDQRANQMTVGSRDASVTEAMQSTQIMPSR